MDLRSVSTIFGGVSVLTVPKALRCVEPCSGVKSLGWYFLLTDPTLPISFQPSEIVAVSRFVVEWRQCRSRSSLHLI